ncbi:MAG TPA: hypothetical protein PKO38_01385 [Bacillota bacterium]|jgi:hypothetical protein|nr:hypothetical protein [Bacillota bacterium]HOB86325.1 hypothetical protein [Bacillota bacterium]HOP69522.1 hypothetical protein [Bacillota bacterium]HPT34459.1 hypothetical protein [Bacillota bacterium]HQD05443.1 hypothetical protein [Bacillota bacterium]
MRSFLLITSQLLLALLLLYGGLNLAERGLADLAVIEREPGAFLVRFSPGEGCTLVFAGRSVAINGEEIGSFFELCRDRLSQWITDFPGKIFKRGNLDKRTGG